MRCFKLVRAYNNALAELKQAERELMDEIMPDILAAERQRDHEKLNIILDSLPEYLKKRQI